MAEQIQVRFAPAGPEQGAATLVRVQRTSSGSFYYFRQNRPSTAVVVDTQSWPAEDRACGAVDSRQVPVFIAVEPDLMVRALATISRARDAARHGTALAPLDCSATGWDGHAALSQLQCLALIAGIDLDRAVWVGRCSDGDPWHCTIVEIAVDAGPIDSIQFRIEDGEAGQAPAQLAVSRITPQQIPITPD